LRFGKASTKEYPYFYVSYLPIIHYSKYYKINNPVELTTIANQSNSFDRSYVPTLKYSKVVSINHDLLSIRRRFIYSRSGDSSICSLPDSNKGKYEYLFNSYTNVLAPITDSFRLIEKNINNIESIEKIINRIAQEKGLSSKEVFVKLYPVFIQYKNIIIGNSF